MRQRAIDRERSSFCLESIVNQWDISFVWGEILKEGRKRKKRGKTKIFNFLDDEVFTGMSKKAKSRLLEAERTQDHATFPSFHISLECIGTTRDMLQFALCRCFAKGWRAGRRELGLPRGAGTLRKARVLYGALTASAVAKADGRDDCALDLRSTSHRGSNSMIHKECLYI